MERIKNKGEPRVTVNISLQDNPFRLDLLGATVDESPVQANRSEIRRLLIAYALPSKRK